MRSHSFGIQKLFTLILQNSCNKYTSTHTTNTNTIAFTMETTLIKATTSTHTIWYRQVIFNFIFKVMK